MTLKAPVEVEPGAVPPPPTVDLPGPVITDQAADLGGRHNSGKPKLSMVMEAPQALAGVAAVLEFGAQKYSRSNWKKGLEHTGIVDSMLRHVTAYLGGEDLDAESGLPHADHIACNALFLAEMIRLRPDLDDRGGAS